MLSVCLSVLFERSGQRWVHMHAKATALPYIYTDKGTQMQGSSEN